MATAPVALIATTACVPLVWGTTYAVTTELLPPDRPLLAAALRALPAGLLLLAVTRRLPRGDWWWRAAVLGSLNIGVFFALLFVSAYRLPGGPAAVLGSAGPLVVLGLSALLLGQRVTTWALGSALAAAAGVALVALTAEAALDPVGVVAGLLGAASMALGLVLTKRWPRPAPVLVVTGWQLTAGGLLLLPLALLIEGPPPALTAVHLGGYAYLSLGGTALAYVLWFRGLDRLPAASVSLLGQLSPVTAAVVGWLALAQGLTPTQLAGGALAVGGVLAGQLTTRPGPGAEQGAGLPDRHRARSLACTVELDHPCERVSDVVPAGMADCCSMLQQATRARCSAPQHPAAVGQRPPLVHVAGRRR